MQTSPPQAELGALRETAKLLVNAENPVIVVDRWRARRMASSSLVQLAELLQVPVVDQPDRMNFPNTHYLSRARRRR